MYTPSNEVRQQLVEKIRDINHPAALRLFFSLLKELIDYDDMAPNDMRLSLAILKEKRISVKINQHVALSIRREREVVVTLIMRKAAENGLREALPSIAFERSMQSDNYLHVRLSVQQLSWFENPLLMRYWQDCLLELRDKASASITQKQHNPLLYQAAIDEAFRAELFIEALSQHTDLVNTLAEQGLVYAPKSVTKPDIDLNHIFYGPPGTGKTHAVQQLGMQYEHRFVTFHQSFGYEEFVEGIRPETVGEKISYKVRKGVCWDACEAALRLAGYTDMDAAIDDTPENRNQKLSQAPAYLLIIDEINRANMSSVLGELITLLEDNKRLGHAQEQWLTLPYSGRKLGIPANLYVVGTMNSSDRSVALLDTALRRRFRFEECMPDATLLTGRVVEDTHLDKLLQTLNQRIAYLAGRDYLIGHAYFWQVDGFESLCEVFSAQIIPLLQEYFYDDWHKIQLVLGDNTAWGKDFEQKLIQVKTTYTHDKLRQLFGEDLDESDEAPKSYQINPIITQKRYDALPRNAFRRIYEKA